MNEKKEYKGIFYNNNSKQKYYEGGAHFSYEELVNILNNIKNQKIINENKAFNKNEIDKEIILKKVPIISRQKNFSMKNIFSYDNRKMKNEINERNFNINNSIKDLNSIIKKINFIKNNTKRRKSLSKKKIKNKKKNMNQNNSDIQKASGQCLKININNNFNNNFINISPSNNISNNIIFNYNNNYSLRFLNEIMNQSQSGKKKAQSRNSKSKGRNFKKNSKINSSIEFNYNYYFIEARFDKSLKICSKYSGRSTGAQVSRRSHNLSIKGEKNINETKYSKSNNGFLGLNYLDSSINISRIFNKNKNGSNNKNQVIESENIINKKGNNGIILENNSKDFNIIKNKNKAILNFDKNNLNKINNITNKNIQINNYMNNKEVKQSVLKPIIINENNIKKLNNFNYNVFDLSTHKKANSLSKEKKTNFDLNINKNKNIFNNKSNKNIVKLSNQSLLKLICLQNENSRNNYNYSIKNKNKVNNIPKKFSKKSNNMIDKFLEKQKQISRNSRINYDKNIKSFEG